LKAFIQNFHFGCFATRDYTGSHLQRSVEADKPRVWFGKQLANLGLATNLYLVPDGKRFVVLMPADNPEQREIQSHVMLVVNFFDEVRRAAWRRKANDLTRYLLILATRCLHAGRVESSSRLEQTNSGPLCGSLSPFAGALSREAFRHPLLRRRHRCILRASQALRCRHILRRPIPALLKRPMETGCPLAAVGWPASRKRASIIGSATGSGSNDS
jgi:hypothetical protein